MFQYWYIYLKRNKISALGFLVRMMGVGEKWIVLESV